MEDIIWLIDRLSAWGAMLPAWIAGLTSIVVAAKGLTVLTPSTADNRFFDALLRLLNVLALNVGKDKNADWVSRPDKAAERRRKRMREATDPGRDADYNYCRPLALLGAIGLAVIVLAGCTAVSKKIDESTGTTLAERCADYRAWLTIAEEVQRTAPTPDRAARIVIYRAFVEGSCLTVLPPPPKPTGTQG